LISKTSTELDVFQVNGTKPLRANKASATTVLRNRFLTGYQESNHLRKVLPD